MLEARLRQGQRKIDGGTTQDVTARKLEKIEGGRIEGTKDGQDQTVAGRQKLSGRQKIRRSIQTIGKRVTGAVAKGTVTALMVGAMAVPAFAQTSVNQGVPLKPVDVRVVQQQELGDKASLLTRFRGGHTLFHHQQRAAETYPFLGAVELPANAGEKMQIMANESLWRMISVAAEEAEGTAELTNFIPTTPVAGELMWSPQIDGPNGDKIDVLPLLLPQVAKADGTIDMDKLKAMFLRVNNPAPGAGEDGVFLGENIGYQNGRAGYFSINAINPEPVVPHDTAGTMLLPQLTLEVNGHKTVYTIGSLCYKGGGPSFKPNGGYSYGHSYEGQKTPLNMTEREPIYSGNTNFGLFDYEPDAKTNPNGWMLLDNGAYAGMSIMEFRLDELVDWKLDDDGRMVGNPEAIPVEQLQADGRVRDNMTPALLWRAFETEYRLSSFKNPDEGVEVLHHMRDLFARDALFDHIANDPALSARWQKATEAVRAGGEEQAMTEVWHAGLESLNAEIAAGKHYAKDRIELGEDGVPTMTIEDYVRTAIQRSARNVVVLHKLDLHHGSIAAGGDNINAAWQMVDLDHLSDSYRALGSDPRDHSNIREFVNNLQMMVDDLKDEVPEMRQFDGKLEDLLKQAIDREAPIYGKRTPQQDNG